MAASPTGGLPPPIPAYLDLFDIEHPGPPIARLAGALDAAFSGDGTLLAERVPKANGSEASQVVRWSDQQVIWHGGGTLSGRGQRARRAGHRPADLPAGPAEQPDRSDPAGRAAPIPVTHGQLTVP